MRARYYNVDIKRFINQDVIEGSITNSPSLNKYAYCQGNPVSLLDPFGLSPQGSSSFGWHLLLDILGFVPVVGIFADIANGFWYLAEGNYAAAIGSFISAVPMIGDTVGIFTTAITGCSKMAKIIGYGTRLFSRVGNMALGVYEFSKNAYELYDRHKDPDFKWDKDTKGLAVNAAVSLGVAAVEAVGFARDIGNYNAVKYDVATSQCFVSGTLVLTIDGNKPIEEIKAGDLVYSTDPETGESEYKEVVQTFENETEELVHISVADDEIVTTPKHPFYVPQKGWTSAIDLRAGDILVLSNGEYVIVEKVQHEILESPVKVYNFEVQDFHTYYVGENSVLVHNKCGEEPDLYHYTSQEGAEGIESSGAIYPDDRGRVFVTTDRLNPEETVNGLFMGQKTNSGDYVVEIFLKDKNDFRLTTQGVTQPNELIYNGALRNGKNAILIVKENFFR